MTAANKAIGRQEEDAKLTIPVAGLHSNE